MVALTMTVWCAYGRHANLNTTKSGFSRLSAPLPQGDPKYNRPYDPMRRPPRQRLQTQLAPSRCGSPDPQEMHTFAPPLQLIRLFFEAAFAFPSVGASADTISIDPTSRSSD